MIKAERTKSLVKRRKSFDFIFSDKISGMAAQLLNRLGQLGVGLAVGGAVINSALFNVDGGTGPSYSTSSQGSSRPWSVRVPTS